MYVCLCIYVWCLSATVCMWMPGDNLKELVLSLQHVGSGRLNSGHQAWWHVPLSTESSHLPPFK